MKGECVCTKVSYTVSETIHELYQCHCSICQKQTGSSAQTGFFCESTHFTWLSGQELISTFKKDSGYSVSFCSNCGSTVPNVFRTGDKYWVPAGAFSDLNTASIKNHIFVENKASWDDIAGEGIQHDGFFPVYL